MANSALTTTVTVPDTLISGKTADSSPDPAVDYVLTFDDSAAVNKKVLLGVARRPTLATEQASTSGTAVTFTGIPAGTKMIIVSLLAVSTNGTGGIKLQLGDAGGVETTGYVGKQAQIRDSLSPFSTARTDGFWITGGGALASEEIHSAHIQLVLEDSSDFTWTCMGAADTLEGGVEYTAVITGKKSLSAELDRVAIVTDGVDTFDAGAINISYF